MYKKIALSLCFTIFLGLLSACTPKGFLHLNKDESSSQKKSGNATKESKINQGISSPIALPPSFDTQPLKPGQSKTNYMPNGLPALKPMKGVNVDTLFAENLRDTGDRFNRVENAVIDIRKEFDTFKPSIVRLAAVESDIQNLIKELEVLLQETPIDQQPIDLMIHSEEVQLQVEQLEPQEVVQVNNKKPQEKPPPVKEKKEPEKPDKTKKPPKQLPQYDGIIAKNLRVGEHADKVRIVIDFNKHTNFSIDLDNDEKLIIIELPDARWIDLNNKTLSSSNLLDSYSVETLNNGKGSMIILSLKGTTKIIQNKRLLPDDENPYHRIYFDLML